MYYKHKLTSKNVTNFSIFYKKKQIFLCKYPNSKLYMLGADEGVAAHR